MTVAVSAASSAAIAESFFSAPTSCRLSWAADSIQLSVGERRLRQLRRAAHGAHVHRFHSRGADGAQAQVRILIIAAVAWSHANEASRFQEDVGRWFLVFHHLAH